MSRRSSADWMPASKPPADVSARPSRRTQQRRRHRRLDRPPKGATRQRAENPSRTPSSSVARAGRQVRMRRRLGVSPGPHRVRAADGDFLDGGVAVAHVVDRHRNPLCARLEHTLFRHEMAQERDADGARPALTGKRSSSRCRRRARTAPTPGRRRCCPRSCGAGRPVPSPPTLKRLTRAPSSRTSSSWRPRPRCSSRSSAAAELDLVFAVDRELMTEGQASPRTERQVVAHAIVLHEQQRHL